MTRMFLKLDIGGIGAANYPVWLIIDWICENPFNPCPSVVSASSGVLVKKAGAQIIRTGSPFTRGLSGLHARFHGQSSSF